MEPVKEPRTVKLRHINPGTLFSHGEDEDHAVLLNTLPDDDGRVLVMGRWDSWIFSLSGDTDVLLVEPKIGGYTST